MMGRSPGCRARKLITYTQMDTSFLLTFVDLLILALQLLILARVILSWVSPNPTNPISRFIVEVTDPVLVPFQKLIPPVSGLDFSPIIALIALQLIQSLAHNLI
jgi:YggT family protein